MKHAVIGKVTTIKCSEAVLPKRLIGYDGMYPTNTLVGIAGVVYETNRKGITTAAGDEISVVMDGWVRVVAGGAITVGAQVTAGTAGKVVAWSSGKTVFGVALEAASADGDEIIIDLKTKA